MYGEEIARSAVSSTPKGIFPKSAHLLKHADFRHVYENGKRHFSGNITVFYLYGETRGGTESQLSPGARGVRIGFTASRALGDAVARNRIRRRTREAVRHNFSLLADLRGPLDVVINPKKSVLKVDFRTLSQEVARAFSVIGRDTAGPKNKSGNTSSS